MSINKPNPQTTSPYPQEHEMQFTITFTTHTHKEYLTVKHHFKNILDKDLPETPTVGCMAIKYIVFISTYPEVPGQISASFGMQLVNNEEGTLDVSSLISKLKEIKMSMKQTNSTQETTGPVERGGKPLVYFVKVCCLADFRVLYPKALHGAYDNIRMLPSIFKYRHYRLTSAHDFEKYTTIDELISNMVIQGLNDNEVLEFYSTSPQLILTMAGLKEKLGRLQAATEKTRITERLGAIKKACDDECSKIHAVNKLVSVQLTSIGVEDLYKHYEAYVHNGRKEFFEKVSPKGVLTVTPSELVELHHHVKFTVNDFAVTK